MSNMAAMSNPSKLKTTKYTWKSPGLWSRFLYFRIDDFLSSPIFCDRDGVNWSLRLYPNNNSFCDDKGEYISMYLQCESDNVVESAPRKIEFELMMKIKVGDNYGFLTEFARSGLSGPSPRDDKNTQCWGFRNFMGKFNLQPKYCTEILWIKCVIEHSEFVLKQNNECQLSNDLGRMLETSDFSDVHFTVNGQIFHAHKSVLAMRSPVFAAMFKYDMVENITGSIIIEDIDSTVFAEFLRFIYTGNVKTLDDIAFELVVAADKYDVDGLKVTCEIHLCKTLTKENAADTLNFANKYRLANLKNNALEFIKAYVRW